MARAPMPLATATAGGRIDELATYSRKDCGVYP